MKISEISLVAFASILVSACSSTKSTTTSNTLSPAPGAKVTANSKSANGIYAPGPEELAAIQARNQKVTLEQLNEGYQLYTQGACVNCHAAENIYQFTEPKWEKIVNSMAIKSEINDAQKAAVHAFVMSIKATESKKGKPVSGF